MPLLHPFTGTEADAKEPVNEDLMKLKYKANIEDLANQIDSISAGGGGAADAGSIAEIKIGGETNEAIYWKRKFSSAQHMLNADSENPSGFDPEGKSLKNELLSFIQINDNGILYGGDTKAYLGQYLSIAKDSKWAFKIKKGVNFFSIGVITSSGSCDSVTILIDGATPTSLSLVDKNGVAATDTFSANSATTFYQVPNFFYGLDGEEHIITIENTDSVSKTLLLEYVEIGYRSIDPSLNETIKLNAGKANIRGAEVSFNEGEHTFGNLDLNGHTGSLKVDDTGTVTALDGECPAMTQVKAEEAVAFSSAVTTLPVKNNFYFPSNGICLLSTPYGNHHLFSYGSKTIATIQTHSFDSILWQSQPTENFTTLNNFDGGAGTATGDLNINYYGTAPILIDSTNNKIDFEITIAGITTLHAATIPSGRYAADLVPLEKAVRLALQAAKPLAGEYHLKYDEDSQLWNIYVIDDEVEAFTLLFSSGLNVANSIHTTIGFANADASGALSYLATTEKQHLCCRVLEKDSIYMYTEDPRIKYNTAHAPVNDASEKDLMERLNLGVVRRLNVTGASMIQVFPDQDCSGMSFNFMYTQSGAIMTYQIDDGQCLYLTQTDTSIAATSVRGRLLTSLISFPRGSRKITIRVENSTAFEIFDNNNYIYFIGCRQYFTKPAYEKLSISEAILKTFDISPVSLYATDYGHNAGTLYSPAASDDNINTITESGSWAGFTSAALWNQGYRSTSAVNAYVDVNFTLVGNGGGIFFKGTLSTIRENKGTLYLSQSAIVEGTDIVQNNHSNWGTNHYDQNSYSIMGLPAGTYIARLKLTGTGTLNISGIGIIDTIAPQENSNNVTDLNNTGQGINYPINVRREVIQVDSLERVPTWLERSGYKEGKSSLVNEILNTPTRFNLDDTATLITKATLYYGNYFTENVSGVSLGFSGFMKSLSPLDLTFSNFTITAQAFIDGVQTLNNFSQRAAVKGGSAPSATREAAARLTQKYFGLSCSHSAGLVFTIADTRGLKNNQTIILDDGTNKEKAVIASFVVGTSFTIKKALTTVVAANVTDIEFQGFHNYEIQANDASLLSFSAFEYEPLKITPSNSVNRRMQSFKYEKVSVLFRGIANNDDIYYPVHSDGVQGNWTTSTISQIGSSVANSFTVYQDLKNISVSTGTVDLQISSERLVPILDEKDRF